MRGAGRMNEQRMAVAHSGKVVNNFQSSHKHLALLAAAFQVKAEHRTRSTRWQLLRQSVTEV